MPVIQITARDDRIGHPRRLLDAIAALPRGASVTFMVHGFRYCPLSVPSDPHRHILSPRPEIRSWKAVSWPRHLRLDRPGADLGVGFGWPAQGPLRRVAARAFVAGEALAGAIRLIRTERPDLAINILAHSLGARVALAALAASGPHDLRQIILLSGAEFRSTARAAVAGKSVRVLNVTSRANLAFDLMFRALATAPFPGERVLGAGLRGDAPDWIDLAIDDAAAREMLARLGFRIRPREARICHWSGYLGPGLFPLYRALFAATGAELSDRMGVALTPAPAPAPSLWQGWAGAWPQGGMPNSS